MNDDETLVLCTNRGRDHTQIRRIDCAHKLITLRPKTSIMQTVVRCFCKWQQIRMLTGKNELLLFQIKLTNVGEIYKARLELMPVRPNEVPMWRVKTVKWLIIFHFFLLSNFLNLCPMKLNRILFYSCEVADKNHLPVCCSPSLLNVQTALEFNKCSFCDCLLTLVFS